MNYGEYLSVELKDSDFKLEQADSFAIVSMIWQPVYVYENHVRLAESNLDMLNLNMSSDNRTLSNKYITLELIGDHQPNVTVDRATFVCASKTTVCPFEYSFDANLTKPNVDYRLQAVLSDGVLAPRKPARESHSQKILHVRTSERKFRVNSAVDTVIEKYAINAIAAS